MEIISPKTLGLRYSHGAGIIWHSKELNSLEGSPQVVNGKFSIRSNKITSLKFCPTVVKGDLDCSKNPIDFLDMPILDIHGDFIFTVHETIYGAKNISKILLNLKTDNLQKIFMDDELIEVEEMINGLFQRKKTGEDIEQLYVEGMNWCCNEGFPESFWG